MIVLPADPFANDPPVARVARVARSGLPSTAARPWRVRQVWSGGQTGADRGGLIGAMRAKVQVGGWAPKGWATEAGPAPGLRTWGLREHREPGYPPRTRANVRGTSGTLLVGDRESPGSRATLAACRELGRPFLVVAWRPGSGTLPRPETVATVRAWLERHRIVFLNVAGNRESKAPGIQAATAALVRAVLIP